MTLITSLLFAMFITLQPPIIINNGSAEPSCWEGDCRIGVIDKEPFQVCQAFCNPAAVRDGGWKKHTPK